MNLEDKKVVVTGGTGSLGHALVRRIMTGEQGKPRSVTVFSRDEAKQHYMRVEYLDQPSATDDIIYRNSRELLRFCIGDVRDPRSFSKGIRGADVIFHAAALKQVPTCEYFPMEAVATNIGGPGNLVQAVVEQGKQVERVIGISTDKACKPVNVMGMTKALQERILLQGNLETEHTDFLCVRYGNVIASRGSVVPLFKDQIAAGGPVTITTKDMTRFLLTLDQAVDTVFAALNRGQRGETFVPVAPAARVVDIAKVLIGKKPIKMTYTGIRPGEKVHEIMVSEEECQRTARGNDFHVIQPVLPEIRRQPRPFEPLGAEYSSKEVTLDGNTLPSVLAAGTEGGVLKGIKA